MDDRRFDDIAKFLGRPLTRKRFLAFLASLAAPVSLASGVAESEARKKAKRRGRGGHRSVDDVASQGNASNPFCGGTCTNDDECRQRGGDACFCDESTGQCITATCGGACTFGGGECNGSPGCNCAISSGPTGECVTTCGGTCNRDSDCGPLPGCACNLNFNVCSFIPSICPGTCQNNENCREQGGDDCACFLNVNAASAELETEGGAGGGGVCSRCIPAGNFCTASNPNACCGQAACVFDSDPEFGRCAQAESCPGVCNDNAQCQQQGGDACVCFLGINTASDALVTQAIAEGTNGACGACRGNGQACDASTECCGQLVCRNGACARKRKPKKKNKKRCARHGRSCQRDKDCCAQGMCYRGKCGEKNTHCHNDRECARGYSCKGGRHTASHRRCRRNGRRKPQRKRNRGG